MGPGEPRRSTRRGFSEILELLPSLLVVTSKKVDGSVVAEWDSVLGSSSVIVVEYRQH